ncbi:MAG: ornithine cyclodeaminase family protein, partial [Bryobacteraceae bacterium]
MLFLTESHIRSLLPMAEAIRILRETFAALAVGQAQNQARRRLVLPSGSVLHSLAGAAGSYFGTKIYSTHPKHGANFFFLLFDAATAKPLAMMEANYLGQIRTGAATGAATDLLAAPEARTLGVIGSGFQARTQIEAISHVRRLSEVRVWGRDETRRSQFAEGCAAAFRLPVEASGSAERAVRDASIVVTATSAKDPVLESAWIANGTLVNAVGSNNPQRRELPADLIERADRIVVDSIEQSRLESGDLLLAWDERGWSTPRLMELQEAAAKPPSWRADTVTIFKSNGLGVE